MIAMAGAGSLHGNIAPAMPATERIRSRQRKNPGREAQLRGQGDGTGGHAMAAATGVSGVQASSGRNNMSGEHSAPHLHNATGRQCGARPYCASPHTRMADGTRATP